MTTKGTSMRNRSKLLLAGLTAALLLGALVSAAPANRVALSSQTFRATWTGLRFIGATTPTCEVTIEGSFHSRTMSKVLEALIGYVTRARILEFCTGGLVKLLTEALPWHIRYNGFAGALPVITRLKIRIIGFEFLLNSSCLFRSSATSPIKAEITRNTGTGAAESLTPEASAIPLISGEEFSCGFTARLEGQSTALTQGATTTKIVVTLVQ
jgi:hypothetical protein